MKEKANEQAQFIGLINQLTHNLDIDFLRQSAKDMINIASRQEAMAVLNTGHPQSKNDLLRKQGVALGLLCDYIDTLKKIDELKKEVQKDLDHKSETDKLFI